MPLAFAALGSVFLAVAVWIYWRTLKALTNRIGELERLLRNGVVGTQQEQPNPVDAMAERAMQDFEPVPAIPPPLTDDEGRFLSYSFEPDGTVVYSNGTRIAPKPGSRAS